MAGKEQKIVLVVPRYNMRRSFGKAHAERLLDLGLERNGGWMLPEDSRYEYIKGYGIRRKPNKADTEATE